jgi:hypothetical protein
MRTDATSAHKNNSPNAVPAEHRESYVSHTQVIFAHVQDKCIRGSLQMHGPINMKKIKPFRSCMPCGNGKNGLSSYTIRHIQLPCHAAIVIQHGAVSADETMQDGANHVHTLLLLSMSTYRMPSMMPVTAQRGRTGQHLGWCCTALATEHLLQQMMPVNTDQVLPISGTMLVMSGSFSLTTCVSARFCKMPYLRDKHTQHLPGQLL